jgi:two-component system, OmpR family, sensor kinase
MTWSIRRRLLAWLVSGVLLSGVIATLVIYVRARDEVDELFDRQLKQIALSLREQEDLSVTQPEPQDDQEEERIVVSAWDRNGSPVFGLARNRPAPPAGSEGYATAVWDRQPWRVYTGVGSSGTVEVAQPLAARTTIAMRIVARILIPIIPIAVALIVLVWVTVRQGLKPLAEVAGALAARTSDKLQPIVIENQVTEVMPFIRALNELLLRLKREIIGQKHFIADAAHEFRTPLAALQLQLELVQTADSTTERAAALAELKRGIERLAHLAHQLLTMARFDPDTTRRPTRTLDLSRVAIGVIGELWPLAKARGVDLGSAEHERMLVQGDPEALRIMLMNIVDNAVRYTPSGGRVDINVRRSGPTVELEVIDTGSGVPPEERDRIFDRFYRGMDQTTDGSGLGLSIVKRIAEQCGAAIGLEDGEDGRGLRVRIVFRAPNVENELSVAGEASLNY